jgi:predicted ArsR family transcriptional regulator
MDLTSTVDDVLTQPTRARLFNLLSELRRAATTDELARTLELHPNGVRQHLEIMVKAGLIVREQEKVGRGRPRDVWAINPGAKPGGSNPTGYAELSRWLVQAIRGGDVDPDRIEERGREIGVELADRGGHADPEIRFHDALAAMGFNPSRKPGRGDKMSYCLNNCPYRDAAVDQQAVICSLHRGITSGLLESIDPDTEMTAFVVKDPERAGCRIDVRGPMIAGSEDGDEK